MFQYWIHKCIYLMYLVLRKAITERQKLGSQMYVVDHEHRTVIINWFFIIVPSFLDSKSSWRLSLMSVTCVPESESAIDVFLLSVKYDVKRPFTHLENSLNDHRFSWSFYFKVTVLWAILTGITQKAYLMGYLIGWLR